IYSQNKATMAQLQKEFDRYVDDYRHYGFIDNTNLTDREEQIKVYLDKKFASIDVSVDTDKITEAVKETVESSVESSVKESLGDVDTNFKELNCHIEKAKEEILHKIPCPCKVVTKDDLKAAIHAVNCHTDHVFGDLTEEIKRHKHHCNEQG
ncbi:MAG: hypothetical protein LUD72_13550, partial [Bacteroidales bacterium]|nr:hypothetical protein [Bacteroidales bacterium]